MKKLSNAKAKLKKNVVYEYAKYSVPREDKTQFIKRLNNTEAEFDKCVAYKNT